MESPINVVPAIPLQLGVRTLLGLVFLAVSILLAPHGAMADESATGDFGTVVTARTGGNALLVWDCTPMLAAMVHDKQSAQTALRSLESRAVRIAGEHANSVGEAQTLTVRVLYEMVGAVNPAYGTPTFGGVERLFDLSVSAKVVKGSALLLGDALENGDSPKEVTITMTGKLPPL